MPLHVTMPRRGHAVLAPLLLAAVLGAVGCSVAAHDGIAAAVPSAEVSAAPRTAGSPGPLTAPRIDGGEYRQQPGRPLLLAFLDFTTGTSRSQLAVLRSMAVQYGPSGLAVAVVDATGRAHHNDLVNLRYDWNLDTAGVLVLYPADLAALARSYGAALLPTTLLIAPNGQVARRWNGAVAPAQDIALPLQSVITTPTPRPSDPLAHPTRGDQQ